MKLKRTTTEAHSKQGRDALAWIHEHATAIAQRSNSDSYSGFGPGGNGRASGISDPTCSAAMAPRDRQADLAAGLFADALYEASRAALRAERIAKSMMALDVKTVETMLKAERREVGVGKCVVCGHLCEGLIVVEGEKREDRLRKGRCDPCRKYLERNHVDRPKALWETVSA